METTDVLVELPFQDTKGPQSMQTRILPLKVCTDDIRQHTQPGMPTSQALRLAAGGVMSAGLGGLARCVVAHCEAIRFRDLFRGRDVAHDDFQQGLSVQVLIYRFSLVLHDPLLVNAYESLTDLTLR